MQSYFNAANEEFEVINERLEARDETIGRLDSDIRAAEKSVEENRRRCELLTVQLNGANFRCICLESRAVKSDAELTLHAKTLDSLQDRVGKLEAGPGPVGEANLDKVASFFDTEEFSEKVARKMRDAVAEKVAEDLDASSVAEALDDDKIKGALRDRFNHREIARHVDLTDLAGELDMGDIDVDYSSLAEHFEASDIALEIPLDSLSEELDAEKIAGHIDLEALAQKITEAAAKAPGSLPDGSWADSMNRNLLAQQQEIDRLRNQLNMVLEYLDSFALAGANWPLFKKGSVEAKEPARVADPL
jgi:predicted  nucleic acid-binding Zn-ribbon protein